MNPKPLVQAVPQSVGELVVHPIFLFPVSETQGSLSTLTLLSDAEPEDGTMLPKLLFLPCCYLMSFHPLYDCSFSVCTRALSELLLSKSNCQIVGFCEGRNAISRSRWSYSSIKTSFQYHIFSCFVLQSDILIHNVFRVDDYLKLFYMLFLIAQFSQSYCTVL